MLESERGQYEGLNLDSRNLWVQWLKLYQSEFESFTYNVRLGKGLDPGPSVSDTTRAQWRALTSKRADVVAERPGQTWLIEVEPRVTARTVGQIVVYAHLLPQYWPVRTSLISAVVCQRLGYDMGSVLKRQNVMWFKFPPAGEPSLPATFQPPAGVTV
jgi:hypothetical protein